MLCMTRDDIPQSNVAYVKKDVFAVEGRKRVALFGRNVPPPKQGPMRQIQERSNSERMRGNSLLSIYSPFFS